MCKPSKRTNTGKPKSNCCQRFKRTISNWCKKIKRCCKKPLCKKKRKGIVIKKNKTVCTLFRKKNYGKSKKSISMRETILDEVDRNSFSKSVGKKLQSYLGDLREYNLYQGISKDSQLNLNASEKEIFRKLAKEYEQKNKKYSSKDFLKNIQMLKKRFSLTLSKGIILKNIADDYENNKYSFTGVIDKSKYNKSNIDINDIDKKDLNKVISHYKAQKKREGKLMNNKFSIKELEIMNKLDAEGLKKKFSLTNSKQLLLKDMFEDLKNEKFKLSTIPENLKKDIKQIDKKKLNKILDYYKSSKEKKRISFTKQSKIKQMKSDIMAKFSSL